MRPRDSKFEQKKRNNMETKAKTKVEKTETPKVEYPEGVRFNYLHDYDTPGRVLTIARICDRESGVVRFGWSINAPSRWTTDQKSRNEIVKRRLPGDQFCRKTGRETAILRMKDAPLVAVLEKNEIPLHGILSYLVKEGDRLETPFHVDAIAREHVLDVPKFYSAKDCKVEEPISHKKSLLDRVMEFLRG
jgi:hypothetical protein